MTKNETKNRIIKEKIRSPKEIYKIIKTYKNIPSYLGKSAVLGGCYDLTHPGHLDLISRSYEYKFEDNTFIDTIIIALNSDSSVKKLKGESRPIINQSDRSFFLASLSYVHFVTIFDEPIIDDVLKTIQPDYFIKSDQYSLETLTENERNIFKDYNIKPLFLPFYNKYSTTHLINQMEASLKNLKCICSERLNNKQ